MKADRQRVRSLACSGLVSSSCYRRVIVPLKLSLSRISCQGRVALAIHTGCDPRRDPSAIRSVARCYAAFMKMWDSSYPFSVFSTRYAATVKDPRFLLLMSVLRYNLSSAPIICSSAGTSDTLNQSLFPRSCLTPGTWWSVLNYKSAISSRVPYGTIANNSNHVTRCVTSASNFGIPKLHWSAGPSETPLDPVEHLEFKITFTYYFYLDGNVTRRWGRCFGNEQRLGKWRWFGNADEDDERSIGRKRLWGNLLGRSLPSRKISAG